MPDVKRWTSTIIVQWRPMLTFTRRRLELLDWFEANCDLVAFTDAPDHVGVAIGTEAQRIRLSRSHLRIELRAPDADLAQLKTALDKALETFAGQDPLPAMYMGVWTSAILEQSYDEARRQLARAGMLEPLLPAGMRAVDCAILTDFESEVGASKAEYGVVEAEELRERLTNPTGRIASLVGLERPEYVPEVNELDEVSLYVESFCVPAIAEPVTNFDEVQTVVRNVEDSLGQLAYALSRAV